MYLGDCDAVVAVAKVVALELDICVCCGRGNARSSNDCLRNRRLNDREEAEEAPKEKESTTLHNVKPHKNRVICGITRRRKREQCTRRIITIMIRVHFYRILA
jgi:hypothetical protein